MSGPTNSFMEGRWIAGITIRAPVSYILLLFPGMWEGLGGVMKEDEGDKRQSWEAG